MERGGLSLDSWFTYIPFLRAVLPLRYVMVALSVAAEEEYLVADIRVSGLGVEGAHVVGEALPGGFLVVVVVLSGA